MYHQDTDRILFSFWKSLRYLHNEGRLDSMSREAITEKGLWGDVREEIRTDGTITWAMCTEGGQF